MKLADVLELSNITWTSPAEPEGADWWESVYNLAPISKFKPPSLKNPQETKIPTAQDGWRKGDSKEARKQAIADLVEIHKRLRRQIGKPEISRTADYPVFPDIQKWL